jgi:thiosulfate/3-mercaptopyruvate sulfurtransferase
MTFRTILSPQALQEHLGDASWRIFDCRHDLAQPDAGEQAYRIAHIPNAGFMHLDRDLSGVKRGNNGRHPLPDAAAFANLLAQRGVSNATQVIAYDDSGGMFAARLWWMLRWLGHEAVAVLDGGLSAWKRASLPLTDVIPAMAPVSFQWRATEHAVDVAFVQAHLNDPAVQLIDARAPERFRGEQETIDPVAGHIPGALNRFIKENLDGDGCFKRPEQLREEFTQRLRARPNATPVCYCGSGAAACHHVLAMEIAGLRTAKLYVGSWSEWCSDPHRPIATGAE